MKKLAPQWIVNDLKASIKFYTESLGFTVDWQGDGPLFAILSRGGVTLMLRQLQKANLKRPNREPFVEAGWHTKAAGAWDAYIWVEDVEALYQQCQKNQVAIIREIENTEYGNRDFEIEDINGYILCFGMEL